jgi:AcrR family transcriptional regulator
MSTSKVTYHHRDLPAALLRSAGHTLEMRGIGALSLREAARRVGVSHNAPYRHFPHREALLAALAAEGFEMLGEELQQRSGRELGEAYVRFALAHPQRFRLMFGGVLPHAKYPALRTAAAAAHQALLEAFKDLPQPALAAAAAWSLVHGLAQLILDGHFSEAQRTAGGGDAFVRQVLAVVRFAQRAA